MKIGIDASILKQHEYKGIANTTWNIIQIWKEKYPEHEYFLVADGKLRLPNRLPKNWHIVSRCAHPLRFIPAASRVPELIRKEGLDVFWGPNHLLPCRKEGCAYVITVCDLAWLRIRGVSSAGTYGVLRLFGKKSCEIADRVIAISKATAQDVHELYHIPIRKIDVCYIGATAPPKRQSRRIKEEKSYFLFLSTIEPRKNPETVLKAFELFCKKNHNDTALVFAGAFGWNTKTFRKRLHNSAYRKQIVLKEYVPENEKWTLLRNATALLYPSLYEGFGIPILEAMSVGTPVITSNISSMPEVGGDAALYVNQPQDAEELADCMQTVFDMADVEKEALRYKMQNRINQFSWDKCADEVMHVLIKAKEEL